MKQVKRNWQEIPVALGWLAASIVLMEVLENSAGTVSALQPLTSILLADTSIFSGWNHSAPFDTAPAKTLTAIFLLLIPAQLASIFMIPGQSICRRAQEKGVAAFASILATLVLVQPLVFVWGLSINGPLKIFGRGSAWGVAATIFLVTFAFSYAVRMVPVLLSMYCTQKQG